MTDPHTGGTPAPRIDSPPPGGTVPAGGQADVTISSNAAALPHELLLLDFADPGRVLSRRDIEPGTDFPSSHFLAIPDDPTPGEPTRYYLAVGIRAGGAAEQQRHVVPVRTG